MMSRFLKSVFNRLKVYLCMVVGHSYKKAHPTGNPQEYKYCTRCMHVITPGDYDLKFEDEEAV